MSKVSDVIGDKYRVTTPELPTLEAVIAKEEELEKELDSLGIQLFMDRKACWLEGIAWKQYPTHRNIAPLFTGDIDSIPNPVLTFLEQVKLCIPQLTNSEAPSTV